ncbi:MAG: D-aminoacyl-tRNA deacylase [Pseudomonadota bacterium]
MIAFLQRVSRSAVEVDKQPVARIDRGLLVLVGVHRDDQPMDVARLAERILGYRVFPDAEGRMNLSIRDIAGGLLLVPQFTLAADTQKGTRPSFSRAAEPEKASSYFDRLAERCRAELPVVETGQFGADLQVELVNDGPVSFWLES